jgi:hypothetical protein
MELIEGPCVSVKQPEQVPALPSKLVTVTSLVPNRAVVEIVTGTVIDVLLFTVTPPDVISPPPLNETVAPLEKLKPVRVRVWLKAPWPKFPGLTLFTVGESST